MAAKTWADDFRYAAIQASMAALDEADLADEPFLLERSFCIPLGPTPVAGVTPGRIMLVTLIVGSTCLIGAVAIGNVDLGGVELILGLALMLGGIALFCLPVVFDQVIVRWLLGARGERLRQRRGPLLCSEISTADRSKMGISIDGDDYVLLLADQQNWRLLIEGISARYQIRAEDVIAVQSFQYLNHVGAQVHFRVNEETTLSMAIARPSFWQELIRRAPLLAFLRPRASNRIFSVCMNTLILKRASE